MNKVYVIGMGPGAYEQMTVKAVRTLEKCDVIVGYTVYIELLKEYFPDKRYLTTSMRQEAARCSVPSRFSSLYPRISCRLALLNTRRRIVMCVLLILYPAMSSIGTPLCPGRGRFRLRFSSSIGNSLIIPVVSFICKC